MGGSLTISDLWTDCFECVRPMTLEDFSSTFQTSFPGIGFATAMRILTFLSTNRQAFVMDQQITSRSAWMTLLEESLVNWTADEEAPACEGLGIKKGSPRKRKRTEALADGSVERLSTKLLALAESLGIKKAAEQQLAAESAVDAAEGPPLLLLPAYRHCGDQACAGRHFRRNGASRDSSAAGYAIIDFSLRDKANEVRGQCPSCRANLFHDRLERREGTESRGPIVYFVNEAKTIKLAEGIFVDRRFSWSLLNQIHFSRASFSSFADIVNADLFSGSPASFKRAHAWRCFLEHSVREVANSRGRQFSIVKGSNEEELCDAAYAQLADRGVMPGTTHHRCEKCWADGEAPPEPADIKSDDDMLRLLDGTSVYAPRRGSQAPGASVVVTDAIVMGPRLCGVGECVNPLADFKDGEFCFGHLPLAEVCRIMECGQAVAKDEYLCPEHADLEEVYLERLLSRREAKGPTAHRPRRREKPDPLAEPKESDPSAPRWTTPQFGAKRSYAFAVVTYACGLIRRCYRLPLREGPEEVLDFLEGAFAGEARPGYVVSDKACLLMKYLCTTEREGGALLWEDWRDTTRFIVDRFHVRAHPDDDAICKRFCRPEILDMEDREWENLSEDEERNGEDRKEKWNTAIAEQINAHLGAYQYFAGSMTPAAFDWFMFVVVWMWNKKRLENAEPRTTALEGSEFPERT